MKKNSVLSLMLALLLSSCNSINVEESSLTLIKQEKTEIVNIGLKNIVDFPIGVAVPADPYPHSLLKSSDRQAIVNKHFDSLTAENIMKMMFLQPEPKKFTFKHADALLDYAEQNEMIVHGHALVWHTQSPKWMNEFSGTKADFKSILSEHVSTVAKHFSGKLASWDVVNEAFLDEGSAQQPNKYRDTIWYNNIGAEYIEMAFHLARAADENVDLYYNDYNISNNSSKLDRVIAMLDDFKTRGVPIDGIGFQVHINTDTPSIENIKASFEKVVKRGVKVRISELDISVNQSEQYVKLTADISQVQRQRYAEVVNAYIETVPAHLRGGITVWGITDKDSWIPGFKKRADWALLFNDDFTEKPALQGMAEGLAGIVPANKTVSFDWFEYQGKDEVFAAPLSQEQYQNPIVAGFFPDPSITRKGNDYYMVNSSFAYAPGVPILHSRDLVNWKLIGHALTNSKQLNYNNLDLSKGAYAPTIRYHDGLFYLINTAVASGGNFFVTAEDPSGEWSDPYWLPEIGGIDPDIFFDDDGKVYIAHNDAPEGEPLYQGHRAIWLWEYDMESKKVIKDSGHVIVDGGVDINKNPIWIEGPHIYKINGWYYLMCAEGGTGDQHSAVIFRTKSLNKPFTPYAGNPILTQRDLAKNRSNPITSTGHADMVQTPEGEWWAVFLGTRPYDKNLYNTGRETFLLPITWSNEWPHILEQGKAIPYLIKKRIKKPTTNNQLVDSDTLTGNFIWRDEFSANKLNLHWNKLRNTYQGWLQFDKDKIHLNPSPVSLQAKNQPVYLGRRQQHMTFEASTALILPKSSQVSAGIVAFQNSKYHYYFAAQKLNHGYKVFLEQVNNGKVTEIKSVEIDAIAGQQLVFSISANKGEISFTYQIAEKNRVNFAESLDATMLSTEIAGGFVGTTLGIHSRIEGGQK
ncbi:MAG: endo-1,4-beta-xylanase [Colwellia sp.]